ncbi:MAG TPA: extracellular solute-binding protein, partial [Actinocrinis sp.]|nr:extracellular solute-binding protein [Actinocrinis sp.]
MMRIAQRRAGVAVAAAALAAVGLTACSSSSSGSAAGSSGGSGASGQAAIAAALQKKSAITVWAWAPQVKDIVAAFEKKYPSVTVNLVNAGTATAEYTKLQNAVKAGSGAPDVAQIEYYALPQFALSGALANLQDYGLGSLKGDYSDAVWGSVDINGQ